MARSVFQHIRKLKPRLVIADFDGVFTVADTTPPLLDFARSKYPEGSELIKKHSDHIRWYNQVLKRQDYLSFRMFSASAPYLFSESKEIRHRDVQGKADLIDLALKCLSPIDKVEIESMSRLNDNPELLAGLTRNELNILEEQISQNYLRKGTKLLLGYLAAQNDETILRVLSANWNKSLIEYCLSVNFEEHIKPFLTEDKIHEMESFFGKKFWEENDMDDAFSLDPSHICSNNLITENVTMMMDDKPQSSEKDMMNEDDDHSDDDDDEMEVTTGEVSSDVVTSEDKVRLIQEWRHELMTNPDLKYSGSYDSQCDVLYIGDSQYDIAAALASDVCLWMKTDYNQVWTDYVFGYGTYDTINEHTDKNKLFEKKADGVYHFILCDTLTL